jgi:hypothetical protein
LVALSKTNDRTIANLRKSRILHFGMPGCGSRLETGFVAYAPHQTAAGLARQGLAMADAGAGNAAAE